MPLLNKIYHHVYKHIFPDYPMVLDDIIGDHDCKLLDVGCGDNSPVQFLSDRLQTVGVDLFEPSIEKSKAKDIHSDYVKIDVLEIENYFGKNTFDVVLASDLIEHITKEDGENLISQMENIARDKVIIFTPNGFLPQGEIDKNPWQVHRSGWHAEEMRKKGYTVYGINGHKSLRGEYSRIKYRPKLFWRVLSDFTQLFLKNRPDTAFQILCVKELQKPA